MSIITLSQEPAAIIASGGMRFPANAADGSLNQAVKAAGPQHPTWLDDEPHKPPFNVAGVDYAVGINDSALPLKSVTAQANLPAGATFVPTGNAPWDPTVVVSSNNVHLDGLDFATSGCYLDCSGTTGTLITNCKFGMAGSKPTPFILGETYIVRYCEFDGANMNLQYFSGLFAFASANLSNVTFEWNWIRNARSDIWSMTGGVQVYRFNFVENLGIFFDNANPAHPDFWEWNGSTAANPVAATIAYNALFQNCNCVGGDAQGFYLGANGGKMGNCTVHHNTMRASPGHFPQGYDANGLGVQMLWWTQGTDAAEVVSGTTRTVHDNWVDLKSCSGFASSRINCTFGANFDMVTGLEPADQRPHE